jgi:O-antigen/teichoic acid export membrane protein
VSSYALAHHRPRWRWSSVLARDLLRYGAEFSPAGLLNKAELLVNPLIVGTFLGAAAVGYVALVTRLVETLGFVLRATWRLSIVTLGRVQGDLARLRRGFEEAMALQVLGVAPVLAAFALGAPWLIPFLFGEQWRPAVELYPFLATVALLASVMNMHAAVLYVLRRNLAMTAIAALRLLALAASAAVLVPLLGLVGYGIASLVPFATFVLADRAVRELFPFSYGTTLRWVAAFLPVLYAPLLPPELAPALVAIPLAVALTPSARAQLAAYVGLVRGAAHR